MVVRGVHGGAVGSTVAGIWLLLLAGLWGRASAGVLLAQYPGPHDPPARFWHMAIDKKSQRVFVGATNRLMQLDPNLRLEQLVITGPRNDSPLCHAKGCSDMDIPLSLMDNYNKILLVDHESRKLISCGSLSQGACYKYKVENISADAEFVPKSIAANDANASTYAYIGPNKYNPWGRSSILYVGTTFTNNGEYRHYVPAISSRDLDSLDIAEHEYMKMPQLMIDSRYRDHFIVQYVYGFNDTDYAYFVIVQKQSHLPGQEEQGYVSRLSRTCINDANYDSYTEVTLQCVDSEMKYNLVQDAKIAFAGEELASTLGIMIRSPVLVAIFRPAKGITNEPQDHSALCLYPLKDIEGKFTENIHMCFNGSVKYRNMEYVSGTVNDGKCGAAGNIPNFCEVGLKISGSTPLVAQAALVFPNVSLSAVTTASTGRHVLAFLGTTDGRIKKVLLSGPEPPEYEELVVDEGSAILPDSTVSPSGDYLYVLSTAKVSRHVYLEKAFE